MPKIKGKSNSVKNIASPPTYAGGAEYCGVESDRLLFALYDSEKASSSAAQACDDLGDKFEELTSKLGDVEELLADMKDRFDKLISAVDYLTETLGSK